MSKNKQIIRGIQPVPERLRNQVYGDDYDNTWKLRYSGLSDSKKRTLRTFLKYQEVKEIYWVPEVNYPRGKRSPDLLIDGVKIEIKEVTTLSSIDHQLRKSYKQIGKIGVVVIDASQSVLDKKDIIARVERVAGRYELAAFAIASGDSIINYSIKKTIQ